MIRLISLLFISFSSFLFSQQEITLSGKITDSDKQPLPFVTVQCAKESDSSIVKGDISDNNGLFKLTLPVDNYFITFRYPGLFTDTIHLSKNTTKTDLGVIVMKPIASLDNVEVVGQQSTMEFHVDKRVFNVGADLNNQGANATQILENIPSVTVDADGNVSLRGNSNVRILIDGKMSGFSSTADALQQLQGDNIEKIEVITNASARYDAEGEAGIINIILKKNKTKGLNGSFGVKGGYFPLVGGDFRMNYKKDKINLFTTYSINYNQSPGYSTTYQHLSNIDTTFTYRQHYNEDSRSLNHYATLGLDYAINDYNNLSASFGIRSGNDKNLYTRLYENLDSTDVVIGSSNRLEDQKELDDLLESNLSYKKTFKNKAEWSTSAKWFNDRDRLKSDYKETFTYDPKESIEFSEITTKENNLTAQTDFTLPFLKEGKFESGIRTQFRDLQNSIRFGEWNNNDWNYPPLYNDKFSYNENIIAGYAMASNTWKKFSLQAGLRVEYTLINTSQESINSKNKRKFLDLFPSGAISYKTTKNLTLQLSYSRRISRPGQWNLMPYMRFGDNRERMVGNPQLKPEYTNSLEAGVLQNWKTGTFLGTIYYRYTTNKIERITTFGEDAIIYMTPMNIALKNAYGVEFNLTYNPLNWLRLNSGFNFYREEITGKYADLAINRTNFAWTNRTSISFSFPKIIRSQLAFNYQAPSVRAQGKMLAIYYFDLGFSRDLLKGSATIGLNIRDLFNSRSWRFITDTPEIYSKTAGRWRQRSIVLVFTYRFNQIKKDATKADFNILEDKGGFQD